MIQLLINEIMAETEAVGYYLLQVLKKLNGIAITYFFIHRTWKSNKNFPNSPRTFYLCQKSILKPLNIVAN